MQMIPRALAVGTLHLALSQTHLLRPVVPEGQEGAGPQPHPAVCSLVHLLLPSCVCSLAGPCRGCWAVELTTRRSAQGSLEAQCERCMRPVPILQRRKQVPRGRCPKATQLGGHCSSPFPGQARLQKVPRSRPDLLITGAPCTCAGAPRRAGGTQGPGAPRWMPGLPEKWAQAGEGGVSPDHPPAWGTLYGLVGDSCCPAPGFLLRWVWGSSRGRRRAAGSWGPTAEGEHPQRPLGFLSIAISPGRSCRR